MIVGEATTTVSATPADVFDFVLDLHRYRQADHKIGKVGTIHSKGDSVTAQFSGRIRGLPARRAPTRSPEPLSSEAPSPWP
jgi:hypothetical protein